MYCAITEMGLQDSLLRLTLDHFGRVFAFHFHRQSMIVKKTVIWNISVCDLLRIVSCITIQTNEKRLEERVNCFHRAERQINRLYAIQPKIWSSCPLYWLKLGSFLQTCLPPLPLNHVSLPVIHFHSCPTSVEMHLIRFPIFLKAKFAYSKFDQFHCRTFSLSLTGNERIKMLPVPR